MRNEASTATDIQGAAEITPTFRWEIDVYCGCFFCRTLYKKERGSWISLVIPHTPNLGDTGAAILQKKKTGELSFSSTENLLRPVAILVK
jgi:hypothetical protein